MLKRFEVVAEFIEKGTKHDWKRTYTAKDKGQAIRFATDEIQGTRNVVLYSIEAREV
jgi:hypothetical protein